MQTRHRGLQLRASIISLDYCLCGVSQVLMGFLWAHRFPPSLQNHASGCIRYTILPLGVHSKYVNFCVHGVL